MPEPGTFAAKVADRLAAWEAGRLGPPRATEAGMREREGRARRFQFIATSLHHRLIQPRLDVLRDRFDNLRMDRLLGVRAIRTVCLLKRTDRFPASTRFMVGIEHEPASDQAAGTWELEFMPILVPFESAGRLPIHLYRPDEPRIVAWVEEAILEFLDTYLRVPGRTNRQPEDFHRDPVCGMAVTRGEALFERRVGGDTYYFCSSICSEAFAASPSFYLPPAAPAP